MIEVELKIGEGNTVAEILARVDAVPSDLIVMGIHGRSGFECLMLGSVTERVLPEAECPCCPCPERPGRNPRAGSVPEEQLVRYSPFRTFDHCAQRRDVVGSQHVVTQP